MKLGWGACENRIMTLSDISKIDLSRMVVLGWYQFPISGARAWPVREVLAGGLAPVPRGCTVCSA